jgi:hypothetical protein
LDGSLLAAVINLSGTLVIFAQSPEMEWHTQMINRSKTIAIAI